MLLSKLISIKRFLTFLELVLRRCILLTKSNFKNIILCSLLTDYA